MAAVGSAETAITELNCTLTLRVSCPQPAGREGDGVQPGLLWKGSEATTRGAIRRGQCHVGLVLLTDFTLRHINNTVREITTFSILETEVPLLKMLPP